MFKAGMADFDGGLKGADSERILNESRIGQQVRFATVSSAPAPEFGTLPMTTFTRHLVAAFVAAVFATLASPAWAQVVYYGAMRPVVPVVAAPVVAAPAYVSNYTPAGNYAAVTAFSPPVVAQPMATAVSVNYPPVVAPAAVTTASYAPVTTAYYAPATTAYYAPVTTAYYAPATTAYYAPATTAYYAPAAVSYAPAIAMPLYRQGLFGGLRPVRTAYFLPY